MAIILRLPEALASAPRELAAETGRSQQDLAREALEEYVRDYPLRAYPKEIRHPITRAPEGDWASAIVLDPPLPAGIELVGLLQEQRQERY